MVQHEPQSRSLTSTAVNSKRQSLESSSACRPQVFSNQAVQSLLNSRVIQAKLTVSQPGDQYEHEADRVADAVMRMPESETLGSQVTGKQIPEQNIQRVCTDCEEELHRQPTEEEDEAIEAKEVAGQTPQVNPGTMSHINAMKGGGRPLPSSVRGFFEPRFGRDFSRVRIHTDKRAADVAGAVKARAFTLGRDIVFGGGQYEPGTSSGQRLLAHELTHVAQRGGAGSLRRQPQAGPEEAESLESGPINVQPGMSDLGPDDVSRTPETEASTIYRSPTGPATGNCSWNCPPAGATAYSAVTSASTNCYGYANGTLGSFLRPGQLASTNELRARFRDPAALAAVGGTAGLVSSYYNPAGIRRNLDADLGSHISTGCTGCCTSPKRKIIAVVTDDATSLRWSGHLYSGVTAAGTTWDFHFYRKDTDKAWSHKRGSLPSERVDSSGAGPICTPCRIGRSYSSGNYTQIVGSWCI